MRNILLTSVIGACLIISACSKKGDGGGGGTGGPGSHGNVSGTIKKISYSSAALKATVFLYERDLAGRLNKITVTNEDSTSGVVSTITQINVILYDGADDKPISYWSLLRNAAQQYDTIFRVYNVYNAGNKIISDSSSWIAFHSRQLYVLQKFTYNGNWVVSNRKDIENADTLTIVDSMNLVGGNLVYDGFYDYRKTSTVQNQQIYQAQFDTKINPLGKLNVAKYMVDRYQFPIYNQNNVTAETITEPGVTTKYKYVYEYSDNDYPVIVYQYTVNGSMETLFRTIKYVYE